MAEVPAMVASAVIVPDTAPSPPQPPSNLKRRQSSASSQDSKRPRLSLDPSADSEAPRTNGNAQSPATPSEPQSAVSDSAPRRRAGADEERKRGKRLFGALLGTLSASGAAGPGRRRAEIEAKQQEKLRAQAAEQQEEDRRRLETVIAGREEEQRKWDEQSMRVRHSNKLATAHFLSTKTEPKIYFKPWELRPEDTAQIRRQLEAAEEEIDRELESLGKARESERSLDGTLAPAAPEQRMNGQGQTADSREPSSTTRHENGESQEGSASTWTAHEVSTGQASREAPDDNEEMFVEAGEDSVIY